MFSGVKLERRRVLFIHPKGLHDVHRACVVVEGDALSAVVEEVMAVVVFAGCAVLFDEERGERRLCAPEQHGVHVHLVLLAELHHPLMQHGDVLGELGGVEVEGDAWGVSVELVDGCGGGVAVVRAVWAGRQIHGPPCKG